MPTGMSLPFFSSAVSRGYRVEKWVRSCFIVLCILAALGPAVSALRLLQELRVIASFTGVTFGWRHWVVLVAAPLLIGSVLLEIARVRWAPVLAAAPLAMLWLDIGPGIMAHMIGDGGFEPTPGFWTAESWQMASYQIGSTVCALWLARVRYSAP